MFAELEVFGNYRVLDGEILEKALLKSLLKMSITLCKTDREINYVNIYEAKWWVWENLETGENHRVFRRKKQAQTVGLAEENGRNISFSAILYRM